MSDATVDGLLAGRVAIVTGGASGIGRATCEALAVAGAAVGVADLDGEGATVVAEEIGSRGGRAIGIAADVGEEASIAAMIEFSLSISITNCSTCSLRAWPLAAMRV